MKTNELNWKETKEKKSNLGSRVALLGVGQRVQVDLGQLGGRLGLLAALTLGHQHNLIADGRHADSLRVVEKSRVKERMSVQVDSDDDVLFLTFQTD